MFDNVGAIAKAVKEAMMELVYVKEATIIFEDGHVLILKEPKCVKIKSNGYDVYQMTNETKV